MCPRGIFSLLKRQGQAKQSGLHLEENGPLAVLRIGVQVVQPQSKPVRVAWIGPRVEQHFAMQDGLNETFGELALEKPRQRDCGDVIVGSSLRLDDLMWDGGPERREPPGRDGDLAA